MKIQEARDFAVAAHGAQTYGDQPYEIHLAAVAANIAEWTEDEDLIAAAWLHDTLEDTAVKPDELADRFGERVARLVWAVTAEGDLRAEKMAAIYRKIAAEPDAALVKLADRVANVAAAPPGSKHLERYQRERVEFGIHVQHRVPAHAWRRLDAAYDTYSRR